MACTPCPQPRLAGDSGAMPIPLDANFSSGFSLRFAELQGSKHVTMKGYAVLRVIAIQEFPNSDFSLTIKRAISEGLSRQQCRQALGKHHPGAGATISFRRPSN